MTERQARILYKAIYHAAGDVFKRHNPCQIQPVYAGPEGQPKQVGIRCTDGSGCCHGCRHLGPKGCTVMSLGCRLWLCGRLYHVSPLVWIKIQMLRVIAEHFGLPTGVRTTIDQDFKHGPIWYQKKKYIPLKQVLS